MRWLIVVLAIGCKGHPKSEPSSTGSGSASVADAAATPDAAPPDAFELQPVTDEEQARIKDLFEKLKAGTKPPGVDVGSFAERYKDFFISDRETRFIAKEPEVPGQRVIEIWPFIEAIGGGGYSQGERVTQDAMVVMTFDAKGQLVRLRY